MVDCTDDIDPSRCECIKLAKKYRELSNTYTNDLKKYNKYIIQDNEMKKLNKLLKAMRGDEELTGHEWGRYTGIGSASPGTGVNCNKKVTIESGVDYSVEKGEKIRGDKYNCKWTESSLLNFESNVEKRLGSNWQEFIPRPTLPKLGDLTCCSMLITDNNALGGGSLAMSNIKQQCGSNGDENTFNSESETNDSKKTWFSSLIDIETKKGKVILASIIFIVFIIIFIIIFNYI